MRLRLVVAAGALALVSAPALHSSAAGITRCTPDVNREVPYSCVHYNDSECELCVESSFGEAYDSTTSFACRVAPYPVRDYLYERPASNVGAVCGTPGHG